MNQVLFFLILLLKLKLQLHFLLNDKLQLGLFLRQLLAHELSFSFAAASAILFGVISLYTISNLQIACTHLQIPSAASDAFFIYSGWNSGLAR